MSGHSKWAKVKYQKAVKDPKKGKAFSKLTNLITVAAREGGDLETNPKLRLAIEKAKALGMPKDNIDRAIQRGTGEGAEGKLLEELICEAYGPAGIAILIQAITDNKTALWRNYGICFLVMMLKWLIAAVSAICFKKLVDLLCPKLIGMTLWL